MVKQKLSKSMYSNILWYLVLPCGLAQILWSVFSLSVVTVDTKESPMVLPVLENLPQNKGTRLPQVVQTIRGRNLWDTRNNIPWEDTEEGEQERKRLQWEKKPCDSSPKLPVDVVGVIYTGEPKKNLVTVKDNRVDIADVYHEGDTLVDNTSYSVFRVVSPSLVQFRYKDKKLCVSLLSKKTASLVPSSSTWDAEEKQEYTVSAAYVAEQLGAGFSKILTTARLSPKEEDGKMQGFQIFSIEKGSLFDKIQLKNNDIITKANGVNLQDPSQGFKVYESFQSGGEVVFDIVRDGSVMHKKVTVQ